MPLSAGTAGCTSGCTTGCTADYTSGNSADCTAGILRTASSPDLSSTVESNNRNSHLWLARSKCDSSEVLSAGKLYSSEVLAAGNLDSSKVLGACRHNSSGVFTTGKHDPLEVSAGKWNLPVVFTAGEPVDHDNNTYDLFSRRGDISSCADVSNNNNLTEPVVCNCEPGHINVGNRNCLHHNIQDNISYNPALSDNRTVLCNNNNDNTCLIETIDNQGNIVSTGECLVSRAPSDDGLNNNVINFVSSETLESSNNRWKANFTAREESADDSQNDIDVLEKTWDCVAEILEKSNEEVQSIIQGSKRESHSKSRGVNVVSRSPSPARKRRVCSQKTNRRLSRSCENLSSNRRSLFQYQETPALASDNADSLSDDTSPTRQIEHCGRQRSGNDSYRPRKRCFTADDSIQYIDFQCAYNYQQRNLSRSASTLLKKLSRGEKFHSSSGTLTDFINVNSSLLKTASAHHLESGSLLSHNNFDQIVDDNTSNMGNIQASDGKKNTKLKDKDRLKITKGKSSSRPSLLDSHDDTLLDDTEARHLSVPDEEKEWSNTGSKSVTPPDGTQRTLRDPGCGSELPITNILSQPGDRGNNSFVTDSFRRAKMNGNERETQNINDNRTSKSLSYQTSSSDSVFIEAHSGISSSIIKEESNFLVNDKNVYNLASPTSPSDSIKFNFETSNNTSLFEVLELTNNLPTSCFMGSTTSCLPFRSTQSKMNSSRFNEVSPLISKLGSENETIRTENGTTKKSESVLEVLSGGDSPPYHLPTSRQVNNTGFSYSSDVRVGVRASSSYLTRGNTNSQPSSYESATDTLNAVCESDIHLDVSETYKTQTDAKHFRNLNAIKQQSGCEKTQQNIHKEQSVNIFLAAPPPIPPDHVFEDDEYFYEIRVETSEPSSISSSGAQHPTCAIHHCSTAHHYNTTHQPNDTTKRPAYSGPLQPECSCSSGTVDSGSPSCVPPGGEVVSVMPQASAGPPVKVVGGATFRITRHRKVDLQPAALTTGEDSVLPTVLCTVHCPLHSGLFTVLCTVHCTVYCPLHRVLSTELCTFHCTLYCPLHFVLSTALWTFHSTLCCTLYSVLLDVLCTARCTLYCPLYSVLPVVLCTARCTLYCPLYSVLPAVLCTARCTLYCPQYSCTARCTLYCPLYSVLPAVLFTAAACTACRPLHCPPCSACTACCTLWHCMLYFGTSRCTICYSLYSVALFVLCGTLCTLWHS